MDGAATIVHDPKEPIPLAPRGAEGPTYLLRVPRVADRAAWRHAVLAAGGRQWPQLELVRQARAAVERLLAGEAELPERLAELDAYAAGIEAAVEAWREDRSDGLAAALLAALAMDERVEAIFKAVCLADPTLAGKLADNRVYPELAGLAAARMFLVGWEGGALPPFKRGLLGVDDGLLDAVPTADLVAVGERIAGLIEPPAERMGNSGSPSGGSSSPTSSSSSKAAPRRTRPSIGSTSDGSAAGSSG